VITNQTKLKTKMILMILQAGMQQKL